jgi:hypothetical protein
VLGMDHVQLSKMERWLREPARQSMVGPRPGILICQIRGKRRLRSSCGGCRRGWWMGQW